MEENTCLETDLDEITEEEVEEALTLLGRKGIFASLRASQQEVRSFFDPSSGWVAEYEDSSVLNILNAFREAIVEDDPDAIKGLYTDQEKEDMVKALEPGSKKRAILLAYFNVSENESWNDESGKFSDRQSYKSDGFPSNSDIRVVMENLKND